MAEQYNEMFYVRGKCCEVWQACPLTTTFTPVIVSYDLIIPVGTLLPPDRVTNTTPTLVFHWFSWFGKGVLFFGHAQTFIKLRLKS